MMILQHKFVEFIPEIKDENVLYISIEYAIAVHLCACGCKKEVVTPLSPTDWALSFNGETVSLSPSIGNWNYPCKSHYWIRNNKVVWASQWTDEEIDLGRRKDRIHKDKYYKNRTNDVEATQIRSGFWHHLIKWFKR